MMMNQPLSLAVLVLSVVLVLVGFAVWLQRELARSYAPPKRHAVQPKTYRLLEKARERLFRRSSDVRFTIFALEGEYLLPIARLGWGVASARSRARFRPGEGMAGLAWEHGESILVTKIGPFVSLKDARAQHRKLFNLSDEDAALMSESQLRATAIIASALKEGSWTKAVLCIDSLDATLIPGPDNAKFWLAIARLSADLARTVCVSHEVSPQTKPISRSDGASLDEVWIGQPPQPSLPLSAPVALPYN